MKYHTPVHIGRERYRSHQEKVLNIFYRIVKSQYEAWRDVSFDSIPRAMCQALM